MLRSEQYAKAMATNTCIWCGQPITFWQKIIRVFWAPWWCNTSIFWKICCSSKCHLDFLEHELAELSDKVGKKLGELNGKSH